MILSFGLGWPWAADTVSAWATAVSSVLVAGGLVFAGLELRDARKVARRQERQADVNDEAVHRPYVVVTTELDRRQNIYLEVANVGRSPALDVTFRFDPPLRSGLDGHRGIAPVADIGIWRGISTLAPGKTLRVFVDTAHARDTARQAEDGPPDGYAVTVEYRSQVRPDRAAYKEAYALDFSWMWTFATIEHHGVHELVGEVKKLRVAADKLVSK